MIINLTFDFILTKYIIRPINYISQFLKFKNKVSINIRF